MYLLKQSTALTVPIFCHDDNGDAVTGLVDGDFTKRVSKNGGAFAALAITITEMEGGFYSLPLAVGDTGTLGDLTIYLTATLIKQVNLKFQVMANILGDTLPANVTQLLGTAWLVPAVAGTPDVNVKQVGGTAQTARDLGLALPAAAPQAAGGLITSIAGNLDLDEMNVDVEAIQASTVGLTFTGAGKVDASVRDWLGGTIPAPNVTGVPKVDVVDWLGSVPNALISGRVDASVGSYPGNTAQTGDAFARLGAPVGASISADIAEIEVETDDITAIKTQTDKLTFTVANQIDANVLDWKSATAPAMTGDAFARLGAPVGASISADIAEVEAETDGIASIPTNPLLTTDSRLNHLDADISSRLAPTVAARTLDVSATGEAGIDWANIGSPTSTQVLNGTTIAYVAGDVQGDLLGSVQGSVQNDVLGDLRGRVLGNVGGALVGVGVQADVEQWKAGVVPATSITGVPKVDLADILGTAVATPATAGVLDVNVKNVGNVAQTGGDIYPAVTNIAVTSAALNQTAASRTITSGTGSGGVANTATADGVYDNVADVAGAIDFYYQFDVSGTVGAVGVGAEWMGYVVGIVNTIKVYAYNWGGTVFDQIGTIVGIAGTVNMTDDWELTSAHTGTGGNAGLVRIRFAATGLTAATVKTDRILLGYAVVPLAASAYTAPDNTSITAVKVQTDKLTFTVANQIDANVLDWKSATAPAMTGDAFARLGAPVAASISADIAEIEAETDAIATLNNLSQTDIRTAVGLASANLDTQLSGIQSDTDNIQTRIPAALVGGRIDASVGAVAANVITAAAIADGAIDAATFAAGAIDAAAIATDAIGSAELAASAVTKIQAGLSTLDAAGVRVAVGLAAANLDTQLAEIEGETDDITLVKAKTDLIPATPAAVGSAMTLTSGERNAIADAYLDRTDGIETGVTPRQSERVKLAALAGKADGFPGNPVHYRDVNDTKNRLTATVDNDGNRLVVTIDGS